MKLNLKIKEKEIKSSAIFAGIICMALFVIGILFDSTRENIYQSKEEIIVELGSIAQLHFDATEFFDVEISKARKFLFDTSKVDLTKVGEYEVTAKYNKETFTIRVDVVDTTKPVVEMTERVIFTNDIERTNARITKIIASVKEESEYTAKLIRFEKKDVLSLMDEYAVKRFEESIMDFATDKEALSTGTEEIPTQSGIYRCVLEIADVHKNAEYREVYVVLDKTPALINDADLQTVKVPSNMLNEKPVIDKTIYKGYDEVDGTLSSDYLFIELELKDEAKHEWTVWVSYTDRAGNESKSEFLAKVEEDKNKIAGNNNNNQENNNGNQNKPSGGGTNNNTQYDTKDANKDGEVSTDEAMMYITPEKQACIDAGYGVVVEFDGGEWYAVLMKDSDHMINGKDGGQILFDYLHAHDLRGDVGGCWINPDNEWYWFIADEIEYSPYNNGDGEIIW